MQLRPTLLAASLALALFGLAGCGSTPQQPSAAATAQPGAAQAAAAAYDFDMDIFHPVVATRVIAGPAVQAIAGGTRLWTPAQPAVTGRTPASPGVGLFAWDSSTLTTGGRCSVKPSVARAASAWRM